MSKFRIGDYVRSKRAPARVQQVESKEDEVVFNDSRNVHDWDRVIVRLVKPRKTLTLTQGLRWLGTLTGCWSVRVFNGLCWVEQRDAGSGRWVRDCPTVSLTEKRAVLKAIVAARKALGVKP